MFYNDIKPIPIIVIVKPIVCAIVNFAPNATDPIMNPVIETTLNTADAHGRSRTVLDVQPHMRLQMTDEKTGIHHGTIPKEIPLATPAPINPITNRKTIVERGIVLIYTIVVIALL